MQELKEAVKAAVKTEFGVEIEPELSRPEEKFGDYSSNVAMQLAKQIAKDPQTIAQSLADKIDASLLAEKPTIAGPGFLNFKLSDDQLSQMVATAINLPESLDGQEVLVEFGDPNPFKEMHIGHLYSYIVGDSISRLLEASGADVKRLSYHGDVGLHVAKAIWGMQHEQSGKELGEYYAAGAKAYDDDEQTAKQIQEVNEQIYKKDNPEVNQLYEKGVRASFEYFDEILAKLEVRTDKRYLESQATSIGVELVQQNLGKVFKQSDGAIIYEGEKANLHTRVFLTSQGLPTYEAKDLGLAELKNRDFPSVKRSIIITAHEQSEYFKVMLAALAEINQALAAKTTHLAHGFVSLSTGKMSSRTGEVYSAVSLMNDVEAATKKIYPDAKDETYLGAVKYGLLKHRLGSDLIYDVAESVSLEGNSGPYLQYAHARAQSILSKAGQEASLKAEFDSGERSLARKISEYPEVVAKATAELMPHHIANYLYELAQAFNSFYEHNRVLGDDRQPQRLGLVEAYAKVLKHGLGLLNINAPDKI